MRGGCWESGRDQRRTTPAGLDWDKSDAGGDGNWLLLGAGSGAKGMDSGNKLNSSIVSCHSSTNLQICDENKNGVLIPWNLACVYIVCNALN